MNFTNFSIENATENSIVRHYNPSVFMQILYAVMFLVLESAGNFLLFCVTTYEKYGMDAQKRTVTNQLLSSICWSTISFNILIWPLIMIVRIFGPQCKLLFVKKIS